MAHRLRINHIKVRSGSEAITAQHKSVSCVKHDTDTWVVEGAI